MMSFKGRLLKYCKTILIIPVLLVLIQGCQSKVEYRTEYITEYVTKPNLNINFPDGIPVKDLEFVVLNDVSDSQLVCLDQSGYEALSLNTQMMRDYILLLRLVINKYKEYYESDSLDGSNEVQNEN